MNVVRNEIRTGLLATITLAILAATLIYLGAPAVLRGSNRFRIYFEDGNGIQPGAAVNLAGRRIGQVRSIHSPVPPIDRPRPELIVMIEVEVGQDALIYREQRVRMVQYSLLSDQVIDFTHANESSGLATEETRFIGERSIGLTDAAPMILEKIDPLVSSATKLMNELQKTATRLTAITADGSDLTTGITGFKKLTENLNEISGEDSSMRKAFKNLESLTGGDSALVEAMNNAKDFTETLANNKDIEVALRNFRGASENVKKLAACLNVTMKSVAPKLDDTVQNAKQFTDTVKRQPWRLIWPSTKKYPEDEAQKYLVLRHPEVPMPMIGSQDKCPPTDGRDSGDNPDKPDKRAARDQCEPRKHRDRRTPTRHSSPPAVAEKTSKRNLWVSDIASPTPSKKKPSTRKGKTAIKENKEKRS